MWSRRVAYARSHVRISTDADLGVPPAIESKTRIVVLTNVNLVLMIERGADSPRYERESAVLAVRWLRYHEVFIFAVSNRVSDAIVQFGCLCLRQRSFLRGTAVGHNPPDQTGIIHAVHSHQVVIRWRGCQSRVDDDH